jgi:hypothetical protein
MILVLYYYYQICLLKCQLTAVALKKQNTAVASRGGDKVGEQGHEARLALANGSSGSTGHFFAMLSIGRCAAAQCWCQHQREGLENE